MLYCVSPSGWSRIRTREVRLLVSTRCDRASQMGGRWMAAGGPCHSSDPCSSNTSKAFRSVGFRGLVRWQRTLPRGGRHSTTVSPDGDLSWQVGSNPCAKCLDHSGFWGIRRPEGASTRGGATILTQPTHYARRHLNVLTLCANFLLQGHLDLAEAQSRESQSAVAASLSLRTP